MVYLLFLCVRLILQVPGNVPVLLLYGKQSAMNKRFASLAVSALLLVSLLSVPALAEGTEAAADTVSDDHVIVTLNPEI